MSLNAWRGLTLIEVLVTLVILMLGLLGLSGLIIKAGKLNYEAYQRQQALAIASDMAERLRASQSPGQAPAVNLATASLYATNAPASSPLGDPEVAAMWNGLGSESIPYGPVDNGAQDHDGGYVWLDELAYYMANAKVSPQSMAGVQTVATYTVGFAGDPAPVLQNAPAVGHGEFYHADVPEKLAERLTGVIGSIRDWHPIASDIVVPISALNRAENSSSVFLGFFGPSLNRRWEGTVKKYRLSDETKSGSPGYCGNLPNGDGVTAVTLCLTGQTQVRNDLGEEVWNVEWVGKTPDAITGERISKVNDGAVDFWNPNKAAPDGGSARHGGSGQVLIGGVSPADPSARNIYTFLSDGVASDSRLSENPLNESNKLITKARLGDAEMSDATRATLINFARGGDATKPACNDADAKTVCNAWRDWPHGDVLHSRPVIVDYTPDQQYIFYLSTDGTLHAVNTADGKEKWAFTIEEALPLQNVLLANQQGEPLIVADGSPSVFVDDVNRDGIINSDDDKVIPRAAPTCCRATIPRAAPRRRRGWTAPPRNAPTTRK